ncbi:Serine/threonine-protein kinase PrkC [Eubacteriaceae bacterium CHKCI005]|uniref:non-specific serine/threonine protein kinase n=1 Tax=Solibaculum mannosilyticum TaxID=2780922 RepID=A0A7I8D5Z8_9FIRM|nr:Stk1 family PASTA domain-containing Ser/Thr kinase [Solibaculum mannosilyticum]BCI60094.1 serine/threonine protein kinase [Solibaculum mannosilyticum]CZT57243.1 Serine/threonine-protein kinase PrkC [Eubacteriaceae bacterium CHKCI005]
MDKYIGKRLDGRYEILETVGVGGMAVVYKAHDLMDDRIVAIKVLKSEYVGNEEFRRRFKNECKAIAVLDHPNIIKVYDVSFGDRIEYIVMEYIDGITLKEYIEQQKVIQWKDAVHFTVQILRALQHAHDKGIIHRDIKPQNIMLLADGTIKVTDFGIARFSRNTSHTFNSEQAIGSVHYISPEQASGEITDEKTDLYSVGVMLYEMLTGRLPFEADSAVSVAIMQMQSTPKMPREINPDIPEGLEQITMRAMQKNPAQRYQSAAEMLKDIDEFKRDPSIHFAYKYFVDETPTRVVDSMNKIKAAETSKPEPEPKKKKSNAIPMLAGIAFGVVLFIVAFILLVGWWTGWFNSSEKSTLDMPSLIGMTMEEAKSQYPDFEIVQETTRYDDAPKDEIVEQTPSEGTNVPKHQQVKVIISLGPKGDEMPDLAGKELAEAKSILNKMNVQYDIQERKDDETAKGSIISTQPTAGSSITKDTLVTLYVSLGPDTTTVTVPPVKGLSEEDAKRVLEKKGLKISQSETQSSDRPKGEVLDSSPKEGEEVAEGSTVKLYISSGKKAENKVDISVGLPNTSTPVYLKVYVGGIEQADLRSSELIPNVAREYNFTLSGTGTTTVTVRINTSSGGGFDDYVVYKVDFDQGKVTVVNQYPFDDPNKGESSKEPSSEPSSEPPETPDPTEDEEENLMDRIW